MKETMELELYKMFNGELAGYLTLHHQTSQQFFTIISAIFAASIAGFFAMSFDPKTLIVVPGLMINIPLCYCGKRMCDRHYRRFLEIITICLKLAPLAGLHEREINSEESAERPFPDDKYYTPERWRKDKEKGSASKFVEDRMKKGANLWVQRAFNYLIIISFVFSAIIILGIIVNLIGSKIKCI